MNCTFCGCSARECQPRIKVKNNSNPFNTICISAMVVIEL